MNLFLVMVIALTVDSRPVFGQIQNTLSLREAFRKDFMIGTAINERQIRGKDSASDLLIQEQFNTVTPENIMKAEIIEPGWNSFNFTYADELVAFAKKNNIRVNAHTLIWHSQLPPFLREVKNADSVHEYFVHHINRVAQRYDGQVYSWDVVNEALNEDGTLRQSVFLQSLGADYIVEAFRLAAKASPHSKLYYNDYNIEQPLKRAGAMAIIRSIQSAGVRIDGVGIQGHWKADKVPFQEIEESIRAFSALHIEVMFTELDLTVLPNPWDNNTADVGQTAKSTVEMNPYPNGLPDSVARIQAEAYARLFRLFLKYKKNVSRVTFWGVSDRQSWLNNWPIPGRTNYPLLFDRQDKPKAAFYSVISTAGPTEK